MNRFENPYKRNREIERELEVLEVDEKHFRKYPPTKAEWKQKKQKEEVESKIFFLTIEQITIKSCIEYFEKQLKNLVVKHQASPFGDKERK